MSLNMDKSKKGKLNGTTLAIIAFAVILIALVFVMAFNVNLIVTYVLVFLLMFVAIFGILPHVFDAM